MEELRRFSQRKARKRDRREYRTGNITPDLSSQITAGRFLSVCVDYNQHSLNMTDQRCVTTHLRSELSFIWWGVRWHEWLLRIDGAGFEQKIRQRQWCWMHYCYSGCDPPVKLCRSWYCRRKWWPCTGLNNCIVLRSDEYYLLFLESVRRTLSGGHDDT